MQYITEAYERGVSDSLSVVMPVDIPSKIHFMVPFPENEDYVGESQVLTFVEAKIKDRPSLSSCIIVALTGLGGAG